MAPADISSSSASIRGPDVDEPLLGADEDVLHGIALGVDGNLRNQSELFVAGDDDDTLIRLQDAGDEAEQRRFSGAVLPQKADVLALADLKGKPVRMSLPSSNAFFMF